MNPCISMCHRKVIIVLSKGDNTMRHIQALPRYSHRLPPESTQMNSQSSSTPYDDPTLSDAGSQQVTNFMLSQDFFDRFGPTFDPRFVRLSFLMISRAVVNGTKFITDIFRISWRFWANESSSNWCKYPSVLYETVNSPGIVEPPNHCIPA